MNFKFGKGEKGKENGGEDIAENWRAGLESLKEGVEVVLEGLSREQSKNLS